MGIVLLSEIYWKNKIFIRAQSNTVINNIKPEKIRTGRSKVIF